MKAARSRDALGGLTGRLSGLFHKKVSAHLPPKLSQPKRFPYGQFQMQITLPGNREYAVEATTDLRHWNEIFSTVASGPSTEFLDTSATNFSYRFYRVRVDNLFSPNVLGYVSVTAPPGFSLIANALAGDDNTIQGLFPRVPEGATLTKFDTHLFRLSKNAFREGQWSNPGETLMPGEGAIFFNPAQEFKCLGMTGEVLQGDLSLPIPAGFSVRSSMLPLPGQLDSDLLFPVADDDVIHLYDRDRQKYLVYAYQTGKWSPEPPILGVGESFWVGKTNAGNWNRTLVLNQAEEPALAVAAA
jgi:hypothetical protein